MSLSLVRATVLSIVCTLAAFRTGARADDARSLARSSEEGEGTRAGQTRGDNSLKTKLVWIPAGSFTMGSPDGEADRGEDETQVRVRITRGFWLGQREVTQSEWTRVMGTTPWRGQFTVKEGADFPAAFISWRDAMKFCQRFTAAERSAGKLPAGWRYALPTEAQWEYACRAGSTTRFSFGPDEASLTNYGWFDGNTTVITPRDPLQTGRRRPRVAGERYPHQVALKKPNPWGLYDMHGNVYEWCRDGYAKELPGGDDPEVAGRGALRMARGGSWVLGAKFCRSAHRSWSETDDRSDSMGFRLALVRTAK